MRKGNFRLLKSKTESQKNGMMRSNKYKRPQNNTIQESNNINKDVESFFYRQCNEVVHIVYERKMI